MLENRHVVCQTVHHGEVLAQLVLLPRYFRAQHHFAAVPLEQLPDVIEPQQPFIFEAELDVVEAAVEEGMLVVGEAALGTGQGEEE